MKTNLKSFALGASLALGLLGVYALAVAIPNSFAGGDVVSAAKMNENFTALKTAVDALETKTTALQAVKSLPAREGYQAYAWVEGVAGTPDAFYSFNPTGAIAVTTSSAGVYNVVFAGTHPAIRSVQVSPYGNTTNNCRVDGWGPGDVNITCFTIAGVAATTKFTINVAN